MVILGEGPRGARTSDFTSAKNPKTHVVQEITFKGQNAEIKV
jgi:hypothetical protein